MSIKKATADHETEEEILDSQRIIDSELVSYESSELSEYSKRRQINVIRESIPLSKKLHHLYVFTFTPRQRDVFDYLALYGGDVKKVAEELGLSERTIRDYGGTIMKYIRENFDVIGPELNVGIKAIKDFWTKGFAPPYKNGISQ